MDDKWAFLSKSTRQKLLNLSEENQFHGVSIAPDRSFKERQKYHQMKIVMNERNTELQNKGILGTKWIIRKMRLEKIEVKLNEA